LKYIYLDNRFYLNIILIYMDDKQLKTDIIDEKVQVINIILDLYPSLKKDRQNIINIVFGKLNKPNKYIFTKILLDNNTYYIDSFGMLMNDSLDFKGIVNNNIIYLCKDITKNKFDKFNKYLKK